ncbi:MAG: hypothetical protein F2799_01365 [Actinobacteria bacterium]|uniref:Unannotated protein n=1 Tax=freshwater metagenome TaxID=449393 RepID=A0A6J7CVP0_9ZZZZ|nr:hypothetical protein [Actinomycetota bacterium]
MPSITRTRNWSVWIGATLVVLGLVPLAGSASATGPKVSTVIANRSGIVFGPKTTEAHSFITQVGSAKRRCQVAQGTPLAALKGTGVVFHLKDFGRCSMNTSASAGLFLDKLVNTTNTGTSGWTFKVNNRAGTAGAADPSGPFGSGPLTTGDKVIWFWCVFDANWACQRNLVLVAPTTAATGSSISVSVRAYDDAGTWVPAVGARVSLGTAKVVTGQSGTVAIQAPSTPGSYLLKAVDATGSSRGGQRAPSFPTALAVS